MHRGLLIIGVVCLLTSACSATKEIAVVDSISSQCQSLGKLKVVRCGDDEDLLESDIEDFQRQARRLQGNTIECCHIDVDETVAVARDPGTGKVCLVWRVRYANAYRCPSRIEGAGQGQ
ncbi:MAG TPA: hypothetical protein VFQ26_01890 [Nitrospiraceae bacterium]|nr:hypothetical protein [Nitrospiraceae bacterium]